MISVIITTYGGNAKLKRAIQSVLDQTNVEKEVIIVDDNNPGSEGRVKTEAIMCEFTQLEEVSYIQHQENRNGAQARNTGIQAAKGEIISFLDDDDFYLSDRLAECERFLHANPETAGVCCGVLCLKNNTHIVSLTQRNCERIVIEDLLLNDSFIGTGSNIFFRRQLVEQLQGFDVHFMRFQDVEFMIRAVSHAAVACIPQIMLVKDVSEIRSFNYMKFRDALDYFNQKFMPEILALSFEKRMVYYNGKALTLLIYAVEDGRKGNADDCLAFLEKFRNMLSITENIVPADIKQMQIKNRAKKGILKIPYQVARYYKDRKESKQYVKNIEPTLWKEVLERVQGSIK